MRFNMGQVMTQNVATARTRSRRAAGALIFVGLLVAPAMLPSAAKAQALGYASSSQSAFPSDDVNGGPAYTALTDEGRGSDSALPEQLRRAVVRLDTREAAGTVIIDT
ncbi:MAG: hypothetical protein ACREC2_10100, partial [Bradyrhizobium sp.]